MERRRLGKTGMQVAPIVFGGNVFGWTIDERTSFEVLDAFVDLGFDAIDTADSYSAWVPGNKGGESETIIGHWLKQRPGMRDKVKIFTKVGSDLKQPGQKGLKRQWILKEIDNSLSRLGIERIDLYFAHWPDGTPYEETLGAFDTLIRAGKVRTIGVSNVDADALGAALAAAEDNNLPAYQVLQPEYNLYDRAKFDGPLCDLCRRKDIGVVTYYSLASGFLSGKYRSKADLGKSKRGEGIGKYLDDKGMKILAALDAVSERHNAVPADVALAWLMARPGVTAPIASATSRQQVERFAKAAALKLSDADIAELTAAGN